MGARHDDLVEVALEDGDGAEGSLPSDGAGPDGSRRAPRRRHPWSRRRRRAVAAAAVALVVGTVAVQWDAAAMHQARLAQVPGLAVSLAVPLRALWQLDGQVLGWSQDGETVLVSTDDAIEAVDATSGARCWSRPGAAAWCDLSASAPAGGDPLGVEPPPEAALCTLADRASVEVLDLATGELRTTITPGWPQWSSALVDGDVVLAGVDDGGRLAVARWSSSSGERAWASAGPVIGDPYQGVSVLADGRDVTVVWSDGSMSVDAATGAVRSVADGQAEVDSVGEPITLPDGSVASQEWDPQSEDPGTALVRVVGADGSERLAAPGFLVLPGVDDGSAPGLVLVQDPPASTTRAYDLVTSTEVWSRAVSPALVLDGRLVGWDSAGDLMALDAGTGEVLWTQMIPRSTDWWSVVSDGVRLLCLEGRDLHLVARSLADGHVLWSLDQPWVSASADSSSGYVYGAWLSVMPSGVVALSGPGRTAFLGP